MADGDTGNVGSRTAIGATWLIAWRMVTRALGLVSTIVLARILLPADFGLVAMATTFSAAIDSLSELGLLDALVRRPDTGHELYDTAFTMQAVRGLLTGGVIAGGAAAVSAWFAEPRLLTILLLLAGLSVLSGFENIGIVEFRRSLRFSMEFKLLFLPRISQFVITIAAAWLLRSYWALIVGIIVAKVSRLAMTYVVHPYRPRFALSRWRDLVGFSFWTWMSSLASLVWNRSDPFILGRFLGAGDLGVYLLAAEVAVLPITELVAPASRALFAGFSAAQNRGTDTVNVALPVVATMLLIVVPLTIGVSATSGYLVAILLGPKWVAAQPLIATFAWLCVFAPFSWVCTTVLTARGLVRQNFYAVAAAALVKAGVIYAASLTHRLDLVAVAAVACVALESLLFTLQLRRCGGARWRDSAGGFLRIGLAAGLTVVALWCSGYGWQSVSVAGGPALVQGALTGLAAALGYVALQFGLWWVAGRPSGPETRLLGLAKGFNLPWPIGARRQPAAE
jgi:lipopolysaccharide exporter